MLAKAIAGAALLVALGTCAYPHGAGLTPDERYYGEMPDGWVPDSAKAVTPDVMWVQEYHNAEVCSGLRGDVTQVHWFLVPGNLFKGTVHQAGKPLVIQFAGYWADGNIYISAGHRNFEWVIRHEALHDILEGGGHNTELFGVKCKAMPGYLE